MKVYRYMSNNEFAKFTAGVPMVRTGKFNARTSSNGFCFLSENTVFENADGELCAFAPEECIEFLSGIVTNDVLVEMEAPEDALTASYGIYADPTCSNWDATITIQELCTKAYDRDIFVPCRYAIVATSGKITWYEL